MDILRHQPIDRVPHQVDQLESRQVAHHPVDRPRIVGQLGVMRARLAAQVVVAGSRNSEEYQPQPRAYIASSLKKFGSLGRLMKKPGCRASCSCNVVVALFMAPITIKSGRWITILMIHPAEDRVFATRDACFHDIASITPQNRSTFRRSLQIFTICRIRVRLLNVR